MGTYESTSKKHGLTPNFLEVVLNKDKLSLLKTGYSHDLFIQYKENPNFYIYRYDGELYIWELYPDVILPNSFREAEVTLEKHAPIFTNIVERAIVTYFRRKKYQIYPRRFSSIWEVESQQGQKNFGALVLHPTLAFSLRNLYSKVEKRQIIALTIRKRGKPIFAGSENEIKSQLTDTRGLKRDLKGNIVASRDNVKRYIEAIGRQQEYLESLREIESSEKEFEYLKNSPQNFNRMAPRLCLPDELKIENFLLVNLPSATFYPMEIPKPTYYYYNERTKKGKSYDQIVSDLRPYSFDLFRNRKLNMLVVSPDEYEGSIGEYMGILKKKLREIFHLYNIDFQLETVKSSESYLEVLNKIDADKYDLAIIVLSERDKEIDTPESPYYLTKAKLLNQRLPTQDLTIEKIRQTNKYIENNIALNIYAKLGGTAWTIEKSEKNISELIIGIGSTTDENAKRIIGFANVFDYNGAYLVGDCSQLSTMDEYAKNLESYLVDTLKHAFYKKGLSEGDRLRLIFHLYKEAGEDHELTAINNALKHFAGYDIQHSLVHLSDSHNFRVFMNQGKGNPKRGTFIQLSYRQALLHSGNKHGVPILVRLDKRSGYKDLYEITKQVLHFAHLSHRTFSPTKQPVTIKYPKLMASMVTELKKLDGWDNTMLDRLNEKLWFI